MNWCAYFYAALGSHAGSQAHHLGAVGLHRIVHDRAFFGASARPDRPAEYCLNRMALHDAGYSTVDHRPELRIAFMMGPY